MDKPNLLVSFSGGETSAYMAWWLWENKRHEYNMIFVFANTGQENEETLLFIRQFESHFNIPIVWIEAVVNPKSGIGNSYKIVDFMSADREGEVFESVIRKHGIPNSNTPHCTRELKQVPIKAYAKSIGWKNYELAIGIRMDEIDRVNARRNQLRIIYPLITMNPSTKPDINLWWSNQKFRLRLKGYQGNCKLCWKKSTSKLCQIVRENPISTDWIGKMELRYGKFIPETRKKLMEKRGELPQQYYPINFFRGNLSIQDIINIAKTKEKEIIDDSVIYPLDESCEVFSNCGD